jgi:hypothetical protein
MIKTKYLTFFIAIIILLFIVSCKKEKNYNISDTMKEYFAYKQGSYWIYKNDSTGSLDSAYVDYYADVYGDKNVTGVTREVIAMNFNSKYLTQFAISYVPCEGPNYLTVSSILHDLPPGELDVSDIVAYYAGWPSDKNVVPGCIQGGVFLYKTLRTGTINNITYNNIIDTKLQTVDSSSTNPDYYFRRILFAKNAGIVKYLEIAKHFNIQRSYSLLRYKVVQ